MIKIGHVDALEVFDFSAYEGDRWVGRGIFIVPEKHEAVLLYDICIFEEKDRRKGYAEDIIKMAQDSFPMIITSYMSKAGRELCLKCGFELKGKFHKKDVETLVWISPSTEK